MEHEEQTRTERQPLPNFVRADEIIRGAEVFWARAAKALAPDSDDEGAEADAATHDGQFFRYVASELVRLSEEFARYRQEHTATSLATWVQYTPEVPLPNKADLDRLARPGLDAEDAVEVLNGLNDRWLEVFEDLSQKVTSSKVSELFASCKALLTSWSRTLSSAIAQLHDV